MKMQAGVEAGSPAGRPRKGPRAKGRGMDAPKTLGFAHCAEDHRGTGDWGRPGPGRLHAVAATVISLSSRTMQPFKLPGGRPLLFISIQMSTPSPGVCLCQTHSHCLNESPQTHTPLCVPCWGEVSVLLALSPGQAGLFTTPVTTLQLKPPFLSQCVLRP